MFGVHRRQRRGGRQPEACRPESERGLAPLCGLSRVIRNLFIVLGLS